MEYNALSSSVGVNYTCLRDLLADGQWQKADEETGAVMLKIARRAGAGWLREEDFQEFPCPDIKTIDQLWSKYSSDRFGFSVQCSVWESVAQDYDKFSLAVGWQIHSDGRQWRKYGDLIFDLQAPVGHLPAAPFFKSGGPPIGWAATLVPKLADCYAEDF